MYVYMIPHAYIINHIFPAAKRNTLTTLHQGLIPSLSEKSSTKFRRRLKEIPDVASANWTINIASCPIGQIVGNDVISRMLQKRLQ